MRFKEISEVQNQMWHQLSDAGPEYKPGSSGVWYWKDEYARDMMMGYNFVMKKGLFDPNDISKTHAAIGNLAQTDPNKIWMMMQGEAWSPEGQARYMIDDLDVGHTSMSVGDIISIGKRFLMVDSIGFIDIATGAEV